MKGKQGSIVMTAPDFFEVSYTINPWMKPEAWTGAPALERAKRQWTGLAETLTSLGLSIEVVPAAPGLPDLVFPANAAVVLDGRALVARFRYPERQGEEAHFLSFFNSLADRGLLSEVDQFPEGMFQEGAGDCLWDISRQVFWAAFGPRSTREAVAHIEDYFGQPTVGLELVTEQFYHLDTCFSVLSGGEILYFPEALSTASQELVADLVPAEKRIVATAEEAASFGLNAVNLGRELVMAAAPSRLKAELEERGYNCRAIDLSSFILSGGASFCMTLRLDHKAHAMRRNAAE